MSSGTDSCPPMSVQGHSRPSRASSRSNHVRFSPVATDNRLRTACREGPFADIAARTRDNFAVRRNQLKRNRKLIPIK